MIEKKEILVADIDNNTVLGINEFLKNTSFKVVCSSNYFSEVIENIKKRPPDVILLSAAIDERTKDKYSTFFINENIKIPIVFILDKNNPTASLLFPESNNILYKPFKKQELLNTLNLIFKDTIDDLNFVTKPNKKVENIILESGKRAYELINKYLNINDKKTIVVSTTSLFNLNVYDPNTCKSFVNLRKINDIRYLNKYFETVNDILPNEGIFIGCAETKKFRKKRILKKYPPVLNYIYYFLDFLIKRVFPKLPITKKIYFFLTGGRNRVLSRAEILGRIYSCGFEVLDEVFVNSIFYFVVKKIRIPYYDYFPSYGALVRMKRFGKNGKIIVVYKLRTMHPFAEYLQLYIYKKNKLAVGGKFKNDFRITSMGRFFRKFWLDELPMIYNVVKGDMKLFGVRPLSKQYFSLYPKEFQEIRLKYKPGLIPPYYCDMPKTFDEIIESEKRYFEKYDKNPFTTDFKYFFKSMFNIILKKARSK